MMSLLRLLAALPHLAQLADAALQLDFTTTRRSPAQSLRRRSDAYLRRRDSVTATLQNAQTDTLYLVNVTVGTPGQSMALQLDTGSSDIWVPWSNSDICQGSDSPCSNGAFDADSSSTFEDIGPNQFEISYVDGTEIKGDYFSDVFGIGGVSVSNMTMGIAKDATITNDGEPFQGIVGVGFAAGESIADGNPDDTYPNIISVLQTQGKTGSQAYSLWLNDLDSSSGSILFGAVDTEKYSGDLVSLPIQPDQDSGTLSSFTVVLDNLNVESGAGKVQYSQSSLAMPVILDSGTTLTYLPDQIAQDIQTGVGAGEDQDAGVYVLCSLMNSPATFNFGFGNSNGPTIQVQISEFVVPYPPLEDGSQPTDENGDEICQWGINGAGNSPNLFGDTFLRSAYVVYDLQNKEIGIAQTVFNTSKSNVEDISGDSIPGASSTATGKVVTQTASGGRPFHTESSAASATGEVGGGSVTATFDLSGTKTAGAGSGSTSKAGSGAGMVQAPSAPFVGFLAAGITSVFCLSGALMIFL